MLMNQFRCDSTGNMYGPHKDRPQSARDGQTYYETDTCMMFRYSAEQCKWVLAV